MATGRVKPTTGDSFQQTPCVYQGSTVTLDLTWLDDLSQSLHSNPNGIISSDDGVSPMKKDSGSSGVGTETGSGRGTTLREVGRTGFAQKLLQKFTLSTQKTQTTFVGEPPFVRRVHG